ncbi:MAG: OmpA family protein, partial [Methylococcales bacterium]|nr:OmpA family protein [Methylococcales bacterium]
MIKKYLTPAILATLITPVLAQASDDVDTRWYVAPYGSFVLADDERNSSDGWGGGLAVGKMLNEHFNVELKGFYQDYGKTSASLLGANSGSTDMAGGTADLQYYFFRDKFSPYAVVGVGGATTSTPNGNHVGFIGEAGVGATYEICDGFFLRSDVRYRYNNNFGGNNDNNNFLLANNSNSSDFNEMVVNVGFVIPLGDKAEKPAPRVELPVVRPTPVADCSTKDDDHDGVNNCVDQCPGTIVGSKVDVHGCPISLEIKGVQFKYDSAELTPNAKIILDGVAKSLIAYPQKNDLEVQGHTSSEGTDQYNQRLSQKRSQSVANYLKHKGVLNKLTAHGYGERQPIADNS